MTFTGPYPTKFSGHTPGMVISATTFSGGVTNAGTIGSGGVTVISSTLLSGGFLNTNLISGAPTGIAVLSGSTIHGAIVDSGRIVATHAGILVSGGIVSSGIAIASQGKISAGSSAIVVRNAATFGGGISNSGTVAGKSGDGILVRNIGTFGGGISNSRAISAKLTGIVVETMDAFFGGISNGGTMSTGGAGIIVDDVTVFANGITNSGTISAGGSGIRVELGKNFSGGVVNRGTIIAKGDTGIDFDAAPVIFGGAINAGTIRAANTGIAATTASTFAGGITNSGTLSAGGVGIRLGLPTIPQQNTVSSFTGDIVNSGTITAKTGIAVFDSTIMGAIVVSGNLLATSHGILIDDTGLVSNASRAGVRADGTKFLGGISNAGSISAITGIDISRAATFTGGISNAGAIAAVTGIAVGYNNGNPEIVSTFAGDIVNSGTISGSVHGIQVGASNISSVNLVSFFTGNISNAGTISAGIVGIGVSHVARFGTSSAGGYVVNTGMIAAASGIVVGDVSTFFGGIKNTGTIVADGNDADIDVARLKLFFLDRPAEVGDAAVENIGLMLATGTSVSIDNVSTLFGGIRNSGVISSTSHGGVIVRDVFTFSGGIANLSGGIIGAAKTGLLVENGATFAGGISNAGTIFAGSAGIEVHNITHFSGGVSNTGAISGAMGIQLIGVQSASVFDAGTIIGAGGTAIEFSGSGNTFTLGAGYVISGEVEAAGSNAFRLGGSGSDTFDLDLIGSQYQGFTSFSVVGGHWNVSGSGGGWVVSSGAFEVVSNTVVSNTLVKSGGTEIVDSGGTAFSTVSRGGLEVAIAGGSGSAGILSGGTMEFVGSGANQAFSATLSAGATLEVGSGFTLSGSIPAGITVMVASGGVVSGGTFVAGERAIVLSGGVMSNSLVGNGGTAILSGGTDLSKVILKGGNTTVSAGGFDSGAIVSSGGKLVVASGGTEADAAVRAGGSAIVSSGGVAELIGSGTTSGLTLLSGAAVANSGTVLARASGSKIFVAAGAVVRGGAVVAQVSGSEIEIFDGATVSGGTLFASGSGSLIEIDSGAVVKGGVAEVGDGLVRILGSSSETVTFLSTGNGGLAIADTSGHATAFNGRVSGFGGTAHANTNQFIDLISVTSAANTISLSYVSAASHTSGTLFVSSGGVQVAAITMIGQYSAGNFHITAGSGGKVEITDPAVPNGGSVAPGPSQSFPQDGIDLPNIAFGARTTLAYAENAAGTGGTLTVSDGRHAASIALLGNYIAGSFIIGADGHGGTLISQVQQTEQTPLLARQPG